MNRITVELFIILLIVCFIYDKYYLSHYAGNPGNFFLGSMFFLFAYVYFRKYSQKALKWASLPTYEEYKRKYPKYCTKEGIRCIKCNHIGVDNRDVDGADKNKRRFVCKGCGAELFRREYAPYIPNKK